MDKRTKTQNGYVSKNDDLQLDGQFSPAIHLLCQTIVQFVYVQATDDWTGRPLGSHSAQIESVRIEE
ncbi:hypothetical protein [Rossellomorea vietnamensis]|uniref:hypothetical protein n=1 Tax=Rossellomorea vietnamensis TaxID=218284 RepID=UPI002078ADE0|nr:hypothetical protein [Rossellomorea vietnamensis]